MHRIYDVNMNHNNEKILPLMNSTYRYFGYTFYLLFYKHNIYIYTKI